MNYQKIILVGNATADAERRKAKSGEVEYTTFNVAVGAPKGETTYFPVVSFGKYGESVAEHVTKGLEVLVEGRIDVGENGRFNVVANTVQFGARAERPKTGGEPAKNKAK